MEKAPFSATCWTTLRVPELIKWLSLLNTGTVEVYSNSLQLLFRYIAGKKIVS